MHHHYTKEAGDTRTEREREKEKMFRFLFLPDGETERNKSETRSKNYETKDLFLLLPPHPAASFLRIGATCQAARFLYASCESGSRSKFLLKSALVEEKKWSLLVVESV